MRKSNRFLHILSFYFFLLLIVFGFMAQVAHAQKKVTSPQEFFGFELGSDRKIARWDKIVEYYKLLENESDKLKVIDMGPSTMGNPFLLVIISSPENLANLDRLREVNAKISDPRGIPESEIKKLVIEGKAVVCQSMSLHATEIGGTQMAPELTYDLVTRSDEETLRILSNVVFFLIPSFNPDGQIMVTDWYRKTVGTEYEGAGLPWLYHKYVGHDNNRDGDFLNMIESVYAAKIMYRDWIPQAYIDHHHMGSYGARFYVPPYCDPIRPYADPLIWREISWYGAHIAYKLEEAGKAGILNDAQFPGWGHFGWHWITPFHNIAGMLTESASARLATPLYIHPEQLRGGARQFPDYEAQSSFPNPWLGGWWRLRDIVEQKKISAWALLDLAARNKETVLWNAYLKAKRQTERGAKGKPTAYVIPAAQHDSLTAVRMVNTLLLSGIEIKKARNDFTVDGVIYPEGSFLISLAQPKMGLIRNLLGQTHYADNAWTRGRDGSPLRPYDLATHNMNEFMGVRVDPINGAVNGDFQVLTGKVPVSGKVETDGSGYVLDGRLNDSFKAVNLLLDRGISIRRIDKARTGVHPGDFIVSSGPKAVLEDVAKITGVDFKALKSEPKEGTHKVKRMRFGMYHRYWGGNMDEGWTRFLLEQFSFPYTSLMDAEIKKGDLIKKYDVIILPDDLTGMITGEIPPRYRRRLSAVPPEYRSGIGKVGVEAVKAFVENGGTLVTLGGACSFAIDKFGLNVRNSVANTSSKEFFCPGSTLKATFDNKHPLAYGMPSEGLVLFRSSMVFEITPGQNNEDYKTVVRYIDRDILRSGWLIGEEHLSNKAAMVCAKVGKGQVILIGFRTQHRCQTHGTFKLLFNALIR
ncbi:MAG: peptidase M14 family protein [Candidatus Aminicenantes bacterium]|nr:MAG: peptidase M14 family protein [Candidatus Aminicenantes bacterium]